MNTIYHFRIFVSFEMSFAIVFLIVGVIVIFLGLLLIVLSYRFHRANNLDIGGQCQTTSDCAAGLQCLNSTCLIPRMGSCQSNPQGCGPGLQCINGECVMLIVPPPVDFETFQQSAQQHFGSPPIQQIPWLEETPSLPPQQIGDHSGMHHMGHMAIASTPKRTAMRRRASQQD